MNKNGKTYFEFNNLFPTTKDSEQDPTSGTLHRAAVDSRHRVEKEGRGENSMAKRVTMELTQKLNGQVGGGRILGKGLSVEGQVKHLIQEARDPLKLCALFCGWRPFA